MLDLENKKIIIATHIYTTGPAQDLREYLLSKKIGKLLFIGHPLFWDENLSGSGYGVYEKGELKEEKYRKIKKNFALWVYSIDIWLNIFWTWRKMPKSNLYVGCDNINAFSGIVLRFFGKTKKVVYYVIDYNPKRFDIKILNYFYHKLDQFCVRHADETWNLSPRMEEARKEYFNFSGGNQITVPIGIWFLRFPRLDFSQIEKHTLVFMGHILEKQGVQYVIDAVPAISEKIPDFKFLVIGGGEYLKKLKEQAKNLGVEKSIEFVGYVEKHSDVEKMLSKCACAVAMYEKYEKKGMLSFTYFSDPGKIKAYLAGGLPILLSDVAHNAKEIEERRCGYIISQDKNEIAQKVIALLRDEKTLSEYRGNAIAYAGAFNWEQIFENNLTRLI
ncbi:MAG: glycosyltransferase [Candidatus Moranbacteria bacterium]|nr:glycosyltransferase [Candidatus Moranbacteria bacterium]